MPVDPEILRDISRRRLGIQDESRVARQRLEQNYETDTSRLGHLQAQTFRDINDQLGSQGLFFSSVRQGQQNQAAQGFGNQLADFGMNKTRGLEDVQRQESSVLNSLLGEEERAGAEATRREEQDRLMQELARAQAEAAAAAAQQPQQTYQQPIYQQPQQQPQYTPTGPESYGQDYMDLWNTANQGWIHAQFGPQFWQMDPNFIYQQLVQNQIPPYYEDPNFQNYIAGG